MFGVGLSFLSHGRLGVGNDTLHTTGKASGRSEQFIKRPRRESAVSASPVVFSGPSHQQALVAVAPGSNVSPGFSQKLRVATARALRAYPPEVRRAMTRHGFHVVAARRISDYVRLEDGMQPARIEAFVKKFKRVMSLQDPVRLAQMDDDAIKASLFELWMKPQIDGDCPAYFVPTRKALVLSEEKLGGEDIDFLVNCVRHEAGHFIDYVLGRELTGKKFSNAVDYRKAIMADVANPNSQPYLTHVKNVGLSEELSYYLPLDKASRTYGAFRESFAEVLSALHGGGGWPQPEAIRDIATGTGEYLIKKVLPQVAALGKRKLEDASYNERQGKN